MPRMIETEASDAIEPGELIELVETGGFDPRDEDSIAAFGPSLKRLANNRSFLSDLAIEELKRNCAEQTSRNHYSGQVILLHTSPRKFAVRANFWPAEDDSVVVNSGVDPFFYNLPHDHNFSFLTAGYLGPGYWSDYYEYDYGRVAGYTDEPVDLTFVGRSRLELGKIMLYRRLRDVHRQLPPDSLSVSLNILALSAADDHFDQYRFDVDRRRVAGIINPSSLANLVALASRFGGGNGKDLVESFALGHPSSRIRFAAWKAKASLESGADGRLAVYDRAAASDDAFVREMARLEMERLIVSRSRMEGAAA